jgi:hypothetical protein
MSKFLKQLGWPAAITLATTLITMLVGAGLVMGQFYSVQARADLSFSKEQALEERVGEDEKTLKEFETNQKWVMKTLTSMDGKLDDINKKIDRHMENTK